MSTTSHLPQPDSIEYWKSLYDDMGDLYGQEAQRLDKAQARVAALEEVIQSTIAFSEADPWARRSEAARVMRYKLRAALAEGDDDDRSGKYPAWDQNEAP